jgi:hypothetical protein
MPRVSACPHLNSAGTLMPDYAKRIGGNALTIQGRLTQLFRQPITGKIKRNINPYEPLASGIRVGFEKGARVTLEVEPKLDHGLSPESCVNTLELDLLGPSRWLSLDFACEWAEISSAQRYQVGIYATVSRRALGRTVFLLPEKEGGSKEVTLSNFELAEERRILNKSGELPNFDFIKMNTDQRPIFKVFLDTSDMPDFAFKIHYISIYFD